MLSAKETEIIIEKFFKECYRYWHQKGLGEREAFERAIKDTKRITRDPNVPYGDLLDVEIKEKFIQYREMDLGR